MDHTSRLCKNIYVDYNVTVLSNTVVSTRMKVNSDKVSPKKKIEVKDLFLTRKVRKN